MIIKTGNKSDIIIIILENDNINDNLKSNNKSHNKNDNIRKIIWIIFFYFFIL
jgi:hypothetical protein